MASPDLRSIEHLSEVDEQICSKCAMLSDQYWLKSQMNVLVVFNILLNSIVITGNISVNLVKMHVK